MDSAYPTCVLGPAAAWFPLFAMGAGPRQVARPVNLIPDFNPVAPLEETFSRRPMQDEVESFVPARFGTEVRWIRQGRHLSCPTTN